MSPTCLGDIARLTVLNKLGAREKCHTHPRTRPLASWRAHAHAISQPRLSGQYSTKRARNVTFRLEHYEVEKWVQYGTHNHITQKYSKMKTLSRLMSQSQRAWVPVWEVSFFFRSSGTIFLSKRIYKEIIFSVCPNFICIVFCYKFIKLGNTNSIPSETFDCF